MEVEFHGAYVFGAYRLETDGPVLLKDHAVVPLTPKALRLLIQLLRHADHVVTKEALLAEVWPDTFVEEGVLSYNIAALRRVLREGVSIETHPKRGYRLIAAVTRVTPPERPAPLGVALPEPAAPTDAALDSSRRRLVSAAAGAALLLISALTLFLGYKPALALKDRQTVILADWVDETGEEAFVRTLRRALAVQLEQSPRLAVYPDSSVRHALRLMSRQPDGPLSSALALEIGERQGLDIVVSGNISRVGSHYLVTLRAARPPAGRVIASEQCEVDALEHVLGRMSAAATRLGERLGGSEGGARRFDAPPDLSTPSLTAWRSFARGAEQESRGLVAEAIASYRRAVEEDPSFASAYAALAVQYSHNHQPGMAEGCARKAYDLRDRVTEYERLRILACYHAFVTGQLDDVHEALLLWKQDSADYGALDALSEQYRKLGQYQRSLEMASRAAALHPTLATAYWNEGRALMRLGRWPQARAAYERAGEIQRDAAEAHVGLFELAHLSGEEAAMRREVEWAAGRPEEHLLTALQARAAAQSGRARMAGLLWRRAIDLALQNQLQDVAGDYAAEAALVAGVTATLSGSAGDAADLGKLALRQSEDRGARMRAALALALAGQPAYARAVAEDTLDSHPKDTIVATLWVPLVLAAIEELDGHAAAACDLLYSIPDYEDAGFWPHYLLGDALLALGHSDEAALEYEAILGDRGRAPTSFLYAAAHLGRARALTKAGRTAAAGAAYRATFALWAGADHDFPLLLQAQRESARLK